MYIFIIIIFVILIIWRGYMLYVNRRNLSIRYKLDSAYKKIKSYAAEKQLILQHLIEEQNLVSNDIFSKIHALNTNTDAFIQHHDSIKALLTIYFLNSKEIDHRNDKKRLHDIDQKIDFSILVYNRLCQFYPKISCEYSKINIHEENK